MPHVQDTTHAENCDGGSRKPRPPGAGAGSDSVRDMGQVGRKAMELSPGASARRDGKLPEPKAGRIADAILAFEQSLNGTWLAPALEAQEQYRKTPR